MASNDFNIDPDRWYWIMIEVVDNQVVAQVSGAPVLKAEHPRFGMPKG